MRGARQVHPSRARGSATGDQPQSRVFLAQGPAAALRGLAKIFPRASLLPRIQGLKVRFRHVHFAADLKHVWRALDVLRDVENRARIRRHIFADRPVAARRGEHKLRRVRSAGSRDQAVDLSAPP